MEVFETVVKEIKSLFKPFEGFQKEVGNEVPFFLLGIAMDAGKGMGWVGSLFVWPFVLAAILAALMILKNLFIFFF